MKLINRENDKVIYRDNEGDIYYVFVKYGDKYILKMVINNIKNFIVDSELYEYCENIMGAEYSRINIYLGKEVRTIDFNNIMVITNDQIESNNMIYTFNGNDYVSGKNIYNGELINEYYLSYFLKKGSLSNYVDSSNQVVKVKKKKYLKKM